MSVVTPEAVDAERNQFQQGAANDDAPEGAVFPGKRDRRRTGHHIKGWYAHPSNVPAHREQSVQNGCRPATPAASAQPMDEIPVKLGDDRSEVTALRKGKVI
jgi:hypothetical protein